MARHLLHKQFSFLMIFSFNGIRGEASLDNRGSQLACLCVACPGAHRNARIGPCLSSRAASLVRCRVTACFPTSKLRGSVWAAWVFSAIRVICLCLDVFVLNRPMRTTVAWSASAHRHVRQSCCAGIFNFSRPALSSWLVLIPIACFPRYQ